MGKSCTILAHVRNSKGEVVESRLFKDLLSYLDSRSLAKEYYYVGTDKGFLDRVRDKAKFDENGEITFSSLKRLAKINVKQERELEVLNKNIKAGVYSYEDAISKVVNFNRNNDLNDDYMATIVKEGNKYRLSVIPRTKSKEAELERTVQDRSLRDRIMYHLNKAGVSVEFLENDDKVEGRYSTVNAEKTADGLYQLIQVANGKKATAILAEEAGHFAIGALGNSPLVERLMKLLTPEVQKEILGEETYEEKYLGTNSAREVAGTLVGKAIMNNVDLKSPWGRLASRIWDLAKRVFATISGNDILKARIEAQSMARSIARGFMSQEQQGDVEEALKIKETLYSAKTNINTVTYRKLINSLNKTAIQLKAIRDDVFAKKAQVILGVAEVGRSTTINADPNTIQAKNMALDGITEALSMILDMIGPGKEVNNLLDSVDFLNTSDFYSSMAENGRKLRQVHTFVQNSIILEEMISDAIRELPGKEKIEGNYDVQFTDNLGNIVSVDLRQVLRDLREANKYLEIDLITKEKQFFLRFLEDSYGSKYVYKASQLLWNIGKTRERNKKNNVENADKLLIKQEGGRVDLSSLLENLETDITFFDRYLSSMSNNSDIIGQICDKVTKMANKMADDLTNETWDKLIALEKDFNKLGIKKEELFEVDDDGNFTGNIVSNYNWGLYERNWQEFKEHHKKEFKDNNPDLVNLSEFERAMRWDTYFRPLSKEWHKKNSRWDKDKGRHVPNDNYENTDFKAFKMSNPQFEVWYDSFMEIKRTLDAYLPEGSTLEVRMPQFKGTYTNLVRNDLMVRGNLAKGTWFALRSKLIDTFCESSEDTDFGSNNTYNSEEEMMFANSLAYEKEKINRVPIYGINKLQDMRELSTDIFGSMLSYAGMAHTYAAKSSIVDTFEVGSEVLNRRTVEGITPERNKKGNASRAYNRYLKFLDKQVYGISSSKTKIYKGVVWEKIVGALTSFASKYFLGGNFVGGTVNHMTGIMEEFKESLSGEYFDAEDFWYANKLYWKSFFPNWKNYGAEFKKDKVSLFIRHFNILGTNKETYRQWNTDKCRRLYNVFGQSLFLPYKSGDHWMQSISYLALANKIKVYDSKGKEMTLFEAYEKDVSAEDSGGDMMKKMLGIKGIVYKSKDGKKKHDLITSIINKLNNNGSGGPFGNIIHLTQEEQDYINSKGYNLADKENTTFKLNQDAENLTWKASDESAFMDKCREINNRMHGIYNNQDKTAFHQQWIGNALLSMKGYALGMMERRWSRNHYSVALGHDVEGSMNTLGKVFFTDSLGFKKTIWAILAPMSGKAKLDMYKAGFSKNQVANMKRNWGDALVLGLLALIRMLTALGSSDDDEDESAKDDVLTGLVYYFSSRVYMEQAAFNIPTNALYELKTLGDLTPSGVAALWDVGKMGYEFVGAPFADVEDKDFYYQSEKEGKYEVHDSKAYVHFWRMFPYLRNTYTLSHPYDAYASYEYGRNIKNR